VYTDEEVEKIGVSKRAVVQRISRKLRPDMQMLRKARSAGIGQYDLGQYYVIDFSRNWVVERAVDVEDLARELELLEPWEAVEIGGRFDE
jgi:hypothetical protein